MKKRTLSQLTDVYDWLIERNQKYNYTFMIMVNGKLVDNPKTEPYLKLILEIKRQRTELMRQNKAFTQNRNSYKFDANSFRLLTQPNY